jgi:hypothetical protein
MTRDDVIKMARESKGEEIFVDMEQGVALFYMNMNDLQRFAQLVAAQAAAEEREACAKLVESQTISGFLEDMPAMLRARGTA